MTVHFLLPLCAETDIIKWVGVVGLASRHPNLSSKFWIQSFNGALSFSHCLSFLFSFSFCLPFATPNLDPWILKPLRPGTPFALTPPALPGPSQAFCYVFFVPRAVSRTVFSFFLFPSKWIWTLTLRKQDAGLGLGEVEGHGILWTRGQLAD